METKISVLPIGPFNMSFQYLSDEIIPSGTVVEIPFGKGNRSILGLVVSDEAATDKELKKIEKIFPYNIGENYIKFLNWVSAYTLIPKGMILKMLLAEKSVFKERKIKKETDLLNQHSDGLEIELNDEQQNAFQAINQNGNRPFLLRGVTGSGKTEIYLKKVQEVLREGKQALILFPEIILTKQFVQRIEKYLGVAPMVWHYTAKHRRIIWETAQSGKSCVVIGTRSALFVPFKNLGIIVVDEEHDSLYKQEEQEFYNARDMAVVLANIMNIPIILSSATPSLESYLNAKVGKYGYFSVQKRFGVSRLPDIHLVDMKLDKFDGAISITLYKEISRRLDRHEQVLLYLNRRGYSPITLCKSCGEKIACPNCTSWMVFHQHENKLICHYCGYQIDVPDKCFSCHAEDSLIHFGFGVEKLQEEVKRKFPQARTIIASSDTFASEKDVNELLPKIANNEVDIIIGTQIFTKGHHFPNITLVGIIDGDFSLQNNDLRAAERTFQLISQVAGRAGRAEKSGEIFIQTFKTDNLLFETIREQAFDKFMDMEIENRKSKKLPPFSKFVSLIISGTNKALTEAIAKKIRYSCPRNITIFGPAPAPIFLLRGRYRWRILLKSLKKNLLNAEIINWLASVKIPRDIKIQIDVDPLNFL